MRHARTCLARRAPARGPVGRPAPPPPLAAPRCAAAPWQRHLAARPPAAVPASTPSFAIERIAGDGSCLFRALAQGAAYLEGRGRLPRDALRREGFALRRAICAHVEARLDEFEPYMAPSPARVYLLAMAVEGAWGGEIELAAAPAVLRRPVCVYQRDGGGGGRGAAVEAMPFAVADDDDDGDAVRPPPSPFARWWPGAGGLLKKVSEYGRDAHPDTAPVCVLYEGRVHYDLLVVKE